MKKALSAVCTATSPSSIIVHAEANVLLAYQIAGVVIPLGFQHTLREVCVCSTVLPQLRGCVVLLVFLCKLQTMGKGLGV